jgi:signal transduction histidine kinase
MREVNAVMLPLVNAKSIRFVIDLPNDPIELVTDPRKIRQILVNLLGNAVKFTEKGQITVSAAVEGNKLVMRVSDTGIGIPAEFHEKIFDPFWQVDHGKTRAVGGTGLGLAVTRELASIMGGIVSVESRVGEGSTFTVSLPLNVNQIGSRTAANGAER